jgi:hypothetical protein
MTSPQALSFFGSPTDAQDDISEHPNGRTGTVGDFGRTGILGLRVRREASHVDLWVSGLCMAQDCANGTGTPHMQ